jgi:hypothetical protein
VTDGQASSRRPRLVWLPKSCRQRSARPVGAARVDEAQCGGRIGARDVESSVESGGAGYGRRASSCSSNGRLRSRHVPCCRPAALSEGQHKSSSGRRQKVKDAGDRAERRRAEAEREKELTAAAAAGQRRTHDLAILNTKVERELRQSLAQPRRRSARQAHDAARGRGNEHVPGGRHRGA